MTTASGRVETRDGRGDASCARISLDVGEALFGTAIGGVERWLLVEHDGAGINGHHGSQGSVCLGHHEVMTNVLRRVCALHRFDDLHELRPELILGFLLIFRVVVPPLLLASVVPPHELRQTSNAALGKLGKRRLRAAVDVYCDWAFDLNLLPAVVRVPAQDVTQRK